MEIKKWNLYSKDEKKNILNHWWHYYGKLLVSFDEIEQFQNLLDSNIEEIYVTALCSYLKGLSSQVLIAAMRQGKIEELFKSLPNINTFDKEINEAFEALSDEFLNEVVNTLNNPEPDIPMSEEEIIRQLI